MRRFTRIFAGAFLVAAAVTLSGCFKSSDPAPYKMSLEVWGVFDDSDAYAKVFSDYRKLNPHISEIRYRKFDEQTYKQDVIDALAAGNGPDIIMVRNSWLNDFRDKILPAPVQFVSEKTLKESFVDVVAADFFSEKERQAYALPLSVDSLALYYNKDLFNIAGITAPPATWEDFLSLVPDLTRIDQFGNITQSAVALGTAGNVNRASDILTLLMLQFGSEMRKDNGQIDIANAAGEKALDFYTKFSKVNSPLYTWNTRQHYSIDSFYEGTLGMTINYAYAYPTFKQKNAKLNIGVAPIPQFSGTVPKNLANYWAFAVVKNKTVEPKSDNEAAALPALPESRKKMREHEAWQFLAYLALPHPGKTFTFSNALTGEQITLTVPNDPALEYLKDTGRPAARKDIIEQQKGDPVLSSFVTGNLIAKNWRQSKPEVTEGHLLSAIEDVVRGDKTTGDALKSAQERIRLLDY